MWQTGLRKASLLTLLIASVFAISYLYFSSQAQNSASYGVPVLASGMALPDFTLIDQDLREFSLHNARGRVVLIFFGYASCPDLCPEVLSKYAVLDKMLGEKAGEVVMIFVTTDPSRDNPRALKELVSRYGGRIVALTGDWEELKDVWLRYHVVSEDVQPPATTNNYFVSHSAVVYVADRELVLRYILTPEMPVERYYEAVYSLLGR